MIMAGNWQVYFNSSAEWVFQPMTSVAV